MHFHSSLLSSYQPFLSYLSPLCFHCCLILYFFSFSHVIANILTNLSCLDYVTQQIILLLLFPKMTQLHILLLYGIMFLTQMLFNSFGEYCCKKAFRYIFGYVLTSLASFMCSEDYMAILVI